jgi:hypothetical protein
MITNGLRRVASQQKGAVAARYGLLIRAWIETRFEVTRVFRLSSRGFRQIAGSRLELSSFRRSPVAENRERRRRVIGHWDAEAVGEIFDGAAPTASIELRFTNEGTPERVGRPPARGGGWYIIIR